MDTLCVFKTESGKVVYGVCNRQGLDPTYDAVKKRFDGGIPEYYCTEIVANPDVLRKRISAAFGGEPITLAYVFEDCTYGIRLFVISLTPYEKIVDYVENVIASARSPMVVIPPLSGEVFGDA
jgi:hypothetical protein